MTYSVLVSELADRNSIQAVDWYESQLVGLGNDFINDLNACYNRIKTSPEAFKFYQDFIREVRLNRFPYIVLYEVFGETIYIRNIFHTSQDPRKKL